MGSEADQANPSDCESLLPPRKRLLAGLKRQNSDCSPPISEELGGDFRRFLNSSELTSEEIIETLRSAALTAAKAAASARQIAAEKAIAAIKAKEFASRVLQLVASVSGDEHCKKIVRKRKSLKKKLSPTDEVLSPRLHRTMNGSTRISRKCKTTGESSGRPGENEGITVHNQMSTSLIEDHTESSDRESSEKPARILTEKSATDWENPSNLQCTHTDSSTERRERKKKEKHSPSHEITEIKNHCRGKQSDEGESTEATSAWGSKKFKISQCHSNGDNLRNLCSISSVKAASALVKVD